MNREFLFEKPGKAAFVTSIVGTKDTLQKIVNTFNNSQIGHVSSVSDLQKLVENPSEFILNKQRAKLPVLADGVEIDFQIQLPKSANSVLEAVRLYRDRGWLNQKFQWEYISIDENGKIVYTDVYHKFLASFNVYLESDHDFSRLKASESLANALNDFERVWNVKVSVELPGKLDFLLKRDKKSNAFEVRKEYLKPKELIN